MKKILLIIPAALFIAVFMAAGCSAPGNIGNEASPVPGVSGSAEIEAGIETKPSQSAEPTSAVPEGWQDGGIFSACYEKAYEKLSQMSLEEKVGQILLARCPDEGAEQSIQQYRPGGFVLFKRDFEGRTEQLVIDTIQGYQDASSIPMAMAVDEEGGSIVRISSNPNLADKAFGSPQQVFAAGGLDAVSADARKKAALLKQLGLNLNLAPVADVSRDPQDYIYSRTLGMGPQETAEYVAAVVKATGGEGLSSALKHFPGYGNNKDTHTGIAVDERSLASFRNNDFIPFEAGIDAGAECVLVSHNIIVSMEKEVPASLSPNVHKILREELGFTGIILTDDLAMDAIGEYTNGSDPSVRALLAGNDMLLTSDFAKSFAAVLEAVQDGSIPRETLDRAVFKILAWKYDKGIIQG